MELEFVILSHFHHGNGECGRQIHLLVSRAIGAISKQSQRDYTLETSDFERDVSGMIKVWVSQVAQG